MPEGQKVASLYAEIGADTSAFEGGMARAGQSLRDFQKEIGLGDIQAGFDKSRGMLQGMTGQLTEADAAAANLANQFDSAGQVGEGVFRGLGVNVMQFAGPLGIGMAITGVGKLAFSLSNMREQDERMTAIARARAGGAAELAAGYAEMDKALGGALVKDEKLMQFGNIMSLGLAKNATEAAELAKQAVYLGDGAQSASQRIEQLTQVLVTGRTQGLRDFGISVQDVNKRVEELKASQSGLSDAEAKGMAIREALAIQLTKVEAEGGKAFTSVEALGSAWSDLVSISAEKVNLEAVVNIITRLTRETTTAMQLTSPEDQTRLEGMKSSLKDMQDRLTYIKDEMGAGRGTFLGIPMYETDYLEGQIRKQKAAIADLQDTVDYSVYAGMGAAIATTAKTALDGVAPMDAWTAAMLRAQAAAGGGLGFVTTLPPTVKVPTTWSLDNPSRWGSPMQQMQGRQADAAHSPAYLSFLETEDEIRTANQKKMNEQIASAAEAAWRDAVGKVQTAFEDAIGYSKGLGSTWPGGAQGPLAPGANGPYEGVYQVKDVAINWGKTDKPAWVETLRTGEQVQRPAVEVQAHAAKWGIGSQEEAIRLSRQFESKDYTELIARGIIDGPKLVAYFQTLGMTEKAADAIYADFAKKAGVPVSVVKGGMEGGGYKPTAAEAGAAGVPIGTINVTVAAGAVTVAGGDATGMGELIGQTIAGALKALSQAEQRVNPPPPPRLPGNPVGMGRYGG